jgi:integrase
VTLKGVRRAAFTYRYRDRNSGKLRQQSLGNYGEDFGLTDARQAVERLRLVADSGQSVRQHVRERQQAAATSEERTIAALVERFLEYMARRGRAESTIKQYRRYLGAVTHRWGDLSPADIRRGDAVDLIDRVIESGIPGGRGRGGHRAGGLLLAAASAFWSWCVEREYAEINPFSNLKKIREETASGINRRTLDTDEIKAVLRGASKHMAAREATVTLMLLATGLRPIEVCGAQWREIDLRAKTWTIPAERMKHKRSGDHVVYLSDFAADLLTAWRKTQRGRPRYVFPGEGRVNGHIVPDALRDAFDDIPGLEGDVTPKVFRATVRTQLQALGCPEEVRSRISHHQRQSRVEQSYDHHRFDAEAKRWWQTWGETLTRLKAGKSNVVKLADKQA